MNPADPRPRHRAKANGGGDPFIERLRNMIAQLKQEETTKTRDFVQLGLDHYDECPPAAFARLLLEQMDKSHASEIKRILVAKEVAVQFVEGPLGVKEALRLARGGRPAPEKRASAGAKKAAIVVHQAFTRLIRHLGTEPWEKNLGPINLKFSPKQITTS